MKTLLLIFFFSLAHLFSSNWELSLKLEQTTIPGFYTASNSLDRYKSYTRTSDFRTFNTTGFVPFSSNDYDPAEISNETIRLPIYAHNPQILELGIRLSRNLGSPFFFFADLSFLFGFDSQNSFTKYFAQDLTLTNTYTAILQYSSLDKMTLLMPSLSFGLKYQNPKIHFLKMVPYLSFSSGAVLLSSVQANAHILSHLDENLVNNTAVTFSNLSGSSYHFVRTLSEEGDIVTTLQGFYLKHHLELGVAYPTGTNTQISLGIGADLINLFVTSLKRQETYTSAETPSVTTVINGDLVSYIEYPRSQINTVLKPYSQSFLSFKLVASFSFLF